MKAFLPRQGRRYPGRAGWTQPYRRWLADLSFALAPQHIALQESRDTIDETERRVERLTAQLRTITPTWRRAPVVDALQALPGVSFVTAVGLVAEIGDIRRLQATTLATRIAANRQTVERGRRIPQSFVCSVVRNGLALSPSRFPAHVACRFTGRAWERLPLRWRGKSGPPAGVLTMRPRLGLAERR